MTNRLFGEEGDKKFIELTGVSLFLVSCLVNLTTMITREAGIYISCIWFIVCGQAEL